MRFCVAALADSIQIVNKNGTFVKCTSDKPKLTKDQQLVTCVQMFVKDHSNFLSNKFAKVTLIDNGKFFSGITPQEILSKKKSIAETLDLLKRFNVWLECSVQLKGEQLVITDSTVLKNY